MILLDKALRQREQEGRPLRIGVIVAGAMARGLVALITNQIPGMEVVAIDALIDITDSVNHGASIVLAAIEHGKPLVLMNAEVDATIGPILHEKARAAGVLLSCCDGDQPGVQLNLWRKVKGMGLIPRVLGNIKGLQDEYRTRPPSRGSPNSGTRT